MRRISLLTLILAAACGPVREDVFVNWTFGNQACDAAGVATIQVDIAGEVLSPNVFTCAAASQGANLGVYLTGNYQITVSGFDASGALAFQTTQTITVTHGGANTFTIDAARVAQTTGDVTMHWTFNGQTCAQAGITTLHVSADNQVITDTNNNPDLPCTSNGIDGSTIGPFPAGAHSFDLVGLDSGGTARFALSGVPVTVVAGQNVVATPNLAPVSAPPTTASANLTWTFDGKSCAAAGVSQVQMIVDPNADGTGGTSLSPIACNTAGTDGGSIDGLTPGNHSFAVYGITAGTLLYRTHHPSVAFFAVGLTTNVAVSAESPP